MNRRAFTSGKALHVTMRSRYTCFRQKRSRKIFSELLWRTAERFNVRIYQNSLNSNHCHLVLYAKSRDSLQNFLRVFAGQLAQRISGATRGKRLRLGFWLNIAWSRVVEWGRAYRAVIAYVYQNQLESLGLVPYRPRGRPIVPVFTPHRKPSPVPTRGLILRLSRA